MKEKKKKLQKVSAQVSNIVATCETNAYSSVWDILHFRLFCLLTEEIPPAFLQGLSNLSQE